eukprot:CAMPEP_0114519586 /NCGR_PEP_ID=MMETSP0109-20121206/19094_1 /TAXON_ID=29199 /ORGANISM="Chlorarachnion reptans, Strain CCCM449" /LENGTH=164 /DNA_ID=CAMNT_0001700359 /DNA_START=325 /DNA_END=819 /DNA_ORIENTATION=+
MSSALSASMMTRTAHMPAVTKYRGVGIDALRRKSSSSLSSRAKRHVRCAAAGEIREIGKDDYYQTLKDAGDKLVIVDFFTDWCGPCKMIYPFLEELARDNADSLEIVKLNCAGENRELVNELGVRVLPTFLFYKNEKNVATVKGAKREDLKNLIAEHATASAST